MKRYNSDFISFQRLAGISAGLLLVVFGSLYFFNVSAQTEAVEKQTAEQQIMVNGRLAFSSMSFGGVPETFLYTSNADGTGRTFVPVNSSPPFGGDPAWSPDGTKLVFAWTQSPYDLHVINATGGGQINITNTADVREDSPSWSATGKIAYVRTASNIRQIWTVNPDGTGSAQFTGITQPSPQDPAWSPDGSKLAFSSNGEIWVINADGTSEQRITTTASADTFPAWSPDGAKIVFRKDNDIAVINADGTNEAPLATFGSAPAWSPDGTKIAFSRSSTGNGIFTMNTDGTNQVRIATNTSNFPLCCDTVYGSPAWQPVAQTPNTFSINGRVSYNNLPVSGATINLTGTTTASVTTDAVGNYQFSGLTAGGNYTVTPSVPNYLFTPASRSFNNLSSNQVGSFEVQGVCVTSNKCVRNGKVDFVYGRYI